MSKYLASVGVYCYEKDQVVVEAFRVNTTKNWKDVLVLHSEFQKEIETGGRLSWLSSDLDKAKVQLDNNDLKIDIFFTPLSEDE